VSGLVARDKTARRRCNTECRGTQHTSPRARQCRVHHSGEASVRACRGDQSISHMHDDQSISHMHDDQSISHMLTRANPDQLQLTSRMLRMDDARRLSDRPKLAARPLLAPRPPGPASASATFTHQWTAHTPQHGHDHVYAHTHIYEYTCHIYICIHVYMYDMYIHICKKTYV
jgi:hypothetical protein